MALLVDSNRPVPPSAAGETHERPKQIHLQKVELGRDYGPETEVPVGLSPGEYIVVNPSDEVKEGALVVPQIVAESKQTRAPGGAADRGSTGLTSEPGQNRAGGSKKQ